MRKIQIILSDDKNNSISAESTIENLNNIMESINLNGIDVMIAKQLQELNKVNKIKTYERYNSSRRIRYKVVSDHQGGVKAVVTGL